MTCLMLCGFVAAGQAQGTLTVFEKDVPVYALEGADLVAFEAGVTARESVPFQDELLAYGLNLPEDWRGANSFGYSLSGDVMVEIGRYNGPVKFNKASSFLTVQAMELDYQTSAVEWFVSDARSNGYSIQGAKEHNADFVESLHIQLRRGESYVVRSLVYLNGSRLVRAAYFLPMDSWAEERGQQSHVMQSFKLLNIVQENSEDTKRYDFYDIASFEYPVSWEMFMRGQKTLDTMEASLIQYDALRVGGRRKLVNGRIELKVFSQFITESLEKEMTKHVEGLVDGGLVVQGFKDDTEKLLMSKNFSNVRVQVYEVLDSKNPSRDTELWLVGMTAGDYFYVTSLLTPERTGHYDLWTRNIQAYKLMLSSFEVQTDGIE